MSEAGPAPPARLRPSTSLRTAAAPHRYWCLQLLSFDYAQINLASQPPRRIDISPLDIHQRSAQCCHHSRSNINTQHDQKLSSRNPINQANCRGGGGPGEGGGDDGSGFMSPLQCSVTSSRSVSQPLCEMISSPQSRVSPMLQQQQQQRGIGF